MQSTPQSSSTMLQSGTVLLLSIILVLWIILLLSILMLLFWLWMKIPSLGASIVPLLGTARQLTILVVVHCLRMSIAARAAGKARLLRRRVQVSLYAGMVPLRQESILPTARSARSGPRLAKIGTSRGLG